MAKVTAVWIDGSGDWNTALDWNTGVVPDNPNTEVVLPTPPSPQSPTYTVTISLGEEFTVASVSITDSMATLVVDGGSSAQTSLTVDGAFTNSGTFGLHNYASVIVDGTFTNAGTLDVDNYYYNSANFDAGGSSLSIGNTLANSGVVNIGNIGLLNATTVKRRLCIRFSTRPG